MLNVLFTPNALLLFTGHASGRRFDDDEGTELRDLGAARDEAAVAVAEMAKDSLPGQSRQEMVIEVRDENRRPLLRAALSFEVQSVE
jgi:hypothetical protein